MLRERTLVIAVTVALAVATSALLAPRAPGAGLKVAATIFPVHDIVRQVAGDVAETVLVLPPGASPHTFEPTPGAVRRLAGARALFVVGHGLDDWAARLARGAGVASLVRVDAGIALRRQAAHGGAVDPHYWLALGNGKAIARTVGAELERLAPPRATEIRAALAAYLDRLDAADAEVRRRLAGLGTRRIATFHDAFGYFAGAYGLEVVAVFEPFPGREPGPRFVREFQEVIRRTGVRVLFSEPQLSVETLRPIAGDLGVRLSVLDPLGGVPGREGYVDLMLFNAGQVAAAAGAGGS